MAFLWWADSGQILYADWLNIQCTMYLGSLSPIKFQFIAKKVSKGEKSTKSQFMDLNGTGYYVQEPW